MDENIPDRIRVFIDRHVTSKEQRQINDQFLASLKRNRQVLWSGMPRDVSQRWADEHGMQTLSTAMGPLMDRHYHVCQGQKKSDKQWSKYVHGASAIFALHISCQSDVVTLLTPPPPSRFHPSGGTSFQLIEEPIIKGKLGNRHVQRIDIVHPTVRGASLTLYQFWPVDQYPRWVFKFGNTNKRVAWRKVKTRHKVGVFVEESHTMANHSTNATVSIQRPQGNYQNDREALRQQQSTERQLLQDEGTLRRKSLLDIQRNEVQRLQHRQEVDRTGHGEVRRGPALHNKQMGEMKELRKKLSQQKVALMIEEQSKAKSMKQRHKAERMELQKQETGLTICEARKREGVGKRWNPGPENEMLQDPTDTAAQQAFPMRSSLVARIYSFAHFVYRKFFA